MPPGRFRVLISCYNILFRTYAIVHTACIVAHLKAYGNCLQRPVIYWLKFLKTALAYPSRFQEPESRHVICCESFKWVEKDTHLITIGFVLPSVMLTCQQEYRH